MSLEGTGGATLGEAVVAEERGTFLSKHLQEDTNQLLVTLPPVNLGFGGPIFGAMQQEGSCTGEHVIL